MRPLNWIRPDLKFCLALIAYLGLAWGLAAPADAARAVAARRPASKATPKVTAKATEKATPQANLTGIRAEIRHELEARAGASGLDPAWGLVQEFYRRRDFRPAWVDEEQVLPRARDLAEIIDHAEDSGLDRRDYPLDQLVAFLEVLPGPGAPKHKGEREAIAGPLATTGEAGGSRLAVADLMFTFSFMSFGSHVSAGRISPGLLVPEWKTVQRKVDVGLALDRVLEGMEVKEALANLEPDHPGYRRLKEAYQHYREIADKGGWPNVPPGPALAMGAKDDRVQALRTRLVAGGDLTSKRRKGRAFDADVENAVKNFEQRHGLEVDGKLDSADVEVMNEPVEERIREMQLNLERWRWLPSNLGDRHIIVNIPEFMLYVYEGGEPVLASKVMVGRSYHPTPVFSDTLTAMVLHPTWTVPNTIAALEILSGVHRDPEFLRANNIRVFEGPIEKGREIDPSTVNWNEVIVETNPYSFREDPGPKNPLGRIKFLLPNRFEVYLHDTPSSQLFQERERSFSYGCVRVEKALELAAYLMRSAGWTQQTVEAALDTVETRTLRVPDPIPVHIVYWTAWVSQDSQVHFRDDLYRLDEMHHREWLKLAQGERESATSKKWIFIQTVPTSGR